MAEIFIDSSALFAWADATSPHGNVIRDYLLKEHCPVVTTHLVFSETISLITKRLGKHYGIQTGEMVRNSAIIRIIHIDEKLAQGAWQLYKKYKDKNFDLIDATSFMVCRDRKISTVLTLDSHFNQMGFATIPKRQS